MGESKEPMAIISICAGYDFINARERSSWDTVLPVATHHGHRTLIEILIKTNAPVQNYIRQMVIEAAEGGEIYMIEYLVRLSFFT
jgi:hypothetical protein